MQRTPPIDTSKLANAVLTYRGNRTLREAAEEAGIDYSVLSRLENEANPDLTTFAKVCEWIGLPMDFFRIDKAAWNHAILARHPPDRRQK